jgi:hypothetical protein
VDRLDGEPLRPDESYRGCTDCRDQCFRDPSAVYAATTRPWDVLRQVWDDPELLELAAKDVRDVIANRGYRHG